MSATLQEINRPEPMVWTAAIRCHRENVGKRGEIGPILEKLAALLQGAGFSPREVFAVRLALEEAVVNAIRHGNRDNPDLRAEIRFAITKGWFLAKVKDQGNGFDPRHVPDPLAPENLERPCGRGLLLMRSFMTWVRFNPRGNCVTLCLYREGAPIALDEEP
jgi:serine/threonine-protein kinase RsbW